MDLVDIIVDWYLFFYVAKRDQFHYQIMFLIDIKMLLLEEMKKKYDFYGSSYLAGRLMLYQNH